MSAGEFMDAERVRRAIAPLIDRLRPECTKLELAGSLRRGRDRIRDVELVAVSARTIDWVERDLFGQPIRRRRHAGLSVDEPLDAMLRAGTIVHPERKAWGDRLRRFIVKASQDVPVELYLADPARFGWILVIRTGPVDFSKYCVQRAKRRGLQVRDGGLYRRTELVPTPTEEAVFELLGWPTPTPEQRNDREEWPRWTTF